MFGRIIKNDLKRNKGVSAILILFTVIAALLVSSGGMMAVQLMQGLDSLMEQAKTPHFLQMHMGDVDFERMESFAARCPLVQDYQIAGFINADNAQIVCEGISFADSVQDNGFCVQNGRFDFLLNMTSEIIRVKKGDIYVPVCYKEERGIKIGDRMSVYGIPFKVAGFLRDSQMNSSLASSKRFVVSDEDYKELSVYGNKEYLIEFRLKNLQEIRSFERLYTNAGLEANGPAITWSQIKLLNAISDGLMIAVILLSGAFLIGIIFMCIRFTVLTQLEEDNREIGIMKAIGLETGDMKKLYYGKYLLLAFWGCAAGLLLSLSLRDVFMEPISVSTGVNKRNEETALTGFVSAMIIFLFIAAFVRKVLFRMKKVSPAKALAGVEEPKSGAKGLSLAKNPFYGSNTFLGIQNIAVRKKTFASLFFIFVFATFIAIVPANLYSTIKNPGFMRYMGVGKCDMRIDVQQSENIEDKIERIEKVLREDNEVKRYVIMKTGTYAIYGKEGTLDNIKAETGDHKIFPIEYINGKAPEKEDEIALSVMNAQELEKEVGDTLFLDGNITEGRKLTVSGIYSDITNGGKTAKAAWIDPFVPAMWYVVNVDFNKGTDIERKTAEYQEKIPEVKVTQIEVFVDKTLGSTITGMNKASVIALMLALFIAVLTVSLFLKLLIVKDSFSIAVLRSMGFSKGDIQVQYGVSFGLTLLTGMAAGTVMANTIGKSMAGMVLLRLGVSGFTFFIDKGVSYILIPAMLMLSVLLTVAAVTDAAGKIKIADAVKE
ncbi:MAG: FtsX-like permease family protein [Clostridiales bacterium]|mgnify:CR=1 FL=1|nr:FtsX-like permease family protein [Clostridiales bacterium]